MNATFHSGKMRLWLLCQNHKTKFESKINDKIFIQYHLVALREHFCVESAEVKGILHQKIFYRPNLIFWIVMGCGIARFGRRGLKITKTWKFWSQNLSPGVSRRSRPGVSRHSTRGFEAQHQGFRGAATWGFEGQQHGVSRGSNTDRTPQWFIISCCPSRSHLITRDLEGWYHR